MSNGTNLSEAGLSEAERAELRAGLWSLLAEQTRRYTSGESSSVRVELAQELLCSVCFCLDISPEGPDNRWRALLGRDLGAALREGLSRVEEKIKYGKRLWQDICTRLPPVENTSMLDTLRSIGTFWKRYDHRFFAHEIACDIDYQLAVPVSENLQGIDYVNRYLERLHMENRFLSKYLKEAMIPVLNLYCPDYKGLLINLFEPVFTNALGLALIGRDDTPLRIRREDLREIAAFAENLRRREIEGAFRGSAAALLKKHGLGEPAFDAYVDSYCTDLAARMEAMRDYGGLGGIFLAEK